MRSALLVDYGGVLTTPIADTLTAWMRAEGLDAAACVAFLRDLEHRSLADEIGPVHGLEIGTWTPAEFERALAAELAQAGLGVVTAEGLLARMFGGLNSDLAMLDLVRRAHDANIRTALVTNSFGVPYPRHEWDRLFDAVIVSSEVGIRKPDPAIFLMACDRLGVPPEAAVFVDDMEPNIVAAQRLGMAGVLHRHATATAMQLQSQLGIALASARQF